MSFPTGWTKKCSLTIDNTKVSGTTNLTNFPVLLTEANFPSTIFDNTQSAGQDLRFTSDEAGTTELAFEIVNWDTTNDKAEVWVKIPTVDYDNDTVFYVWYGNAGASAYGATDTYGSQAVWGDYEGVWHLTNANDSSASGYNCTLGSGGQAPTSTAGLIGTATTGAYDFEKSSSQYMYNNTVPNLVIATNQTWQAWFKPEQVDLERITFVCNSSVSGFAGIGVDDETGTALARTSFREIGTPAQNNIEGPTTIVVGNVYLIHGQLDATNRKGYTYVNGSGSVEDNSSDRDTASGEVFAIGKLGAVEQYCDGVIDEVRVRASVLSAGWIATEYNNQSSPATFVTEGTETDVGSTGISASKRSINC